MNSIRTIFREIFGLFVDDASFAVLILLWLAVIIFLLPRLGWMLQWGGIFLFIGLAAILMGSAIQYARREKD